MEKKTMMVDMDDVLCHSQILTYINEFLGTNYEYDDFTQYRLQCLLEDEKDAFWQWVCQYNLYDGAELFPDAKEVLEEYHKYIDFYIVTAYLWDGIVDISADNLKNKYNYLKSELPFINPDRYIFTTNKKLMSFDIRLDDKVENIDHPAAETKLLYTEWHNRFITDNELNKLGIKRVNNWQEVGRELSKRI